MRKKKKWAGIFLAGLSLFGQNESVSQEHTITQEKEPIVLEQQVPSIDYLHKKLMSKEELNSQELSTLFSIAQRIEEKSPRESNDNLLTQVEKDLRYFASILHRKKRTEEISEELKNFKKKYFNKTSSRFLRNVRNQNESLYLHEKHVAIDFTVINPQLAEQININSKKYDINPRLVTAICTIENNFGLLRVSSSNARGMCQTKVPLTRNYFPNYDDLSEAEKNWAHFLTTFEYLKHLKKNYNLAIGFNDAPFENKLDFLYAGLFYYNGETRVFTRDNIIYQSDSKEYLLRLLDSFHYKIFKLGEDDYY